MTKEQHIFYSKSQVSRDIEAAEILFIAKYYAQSLFWAHLAVEKLLKALWIYRRKENTPPFVHNLLRIALECDSNFSANDMEYFAQMNIFQIKGRYPDYAENLEVTLTEVVAEEN